MWIASLIDRLDEYASAQDDAKRRVEPFAVGASLAFDGEPAAMTLRDFADLVRRNTATARAFFSHGSRGGAGFAFDDRLLTFSSPVQTETEANNTVVARVYEAGQCQSAVVVLPHWNAPAGSYRTLCKILAALGVTAIELTLPYHGSRSRPGSAGADYFVSANLGRTIRSTRQSVLDTRRALDWLSLRGYREIVLLGVSMGSCIAGLVAAHDSRVRASMLLLTAGDFAEVVWTSRATRHIKESLQASLSLDDLRSAWSIISSGTFARALSRNGHDTLVISGARDRIAQPALTGRLCRQLESHGAKYDWKEFNCGHYSMGVFPFNVMTLSALIRFLRTTGALSRRKEPGTLKTPVSISTRANSFTGRR